MKAMPQLIRMTSHSALCIPPFRCQYQAAVINRLEQISSSTVGIGRFSQEFGQASLNPLHGPGVHLRKEETDMTRTLSDISEKMRDIDFCMLATHASNGTIASRPMSNNREVDYDGDSWFFTS